MSSHSTSSLGAHTWSQTLKHYQFDVNAGQVLYIGNLMSRICVGAAGKIHHGQRVWAAIGDVRDMSERDIPLIYKKYPQLVDLRVSVNVMQGEPWLWRFQMDNWFDLNETPPYGWPKQCSLENEILNLYLKREANNQQ